VNDVKVDDFTKDVFPINSLELFISIVLFGFFSSKCIDQFVIHSAEKGVASTLLLQLVSDGYVDQLIFLIEVIYQWLEIFKVIHDLLETLFARYKKLLEFHFY
jgi:hypothetical protein